MASTITTRLHDGREEVLDPVRQRYVALTPEEHVRQSLIYYLHHEMGYPLHLMQVEAAITLGGLTRRCDVVVYNADVKPVMIVETKKPDVPIDQKVVDQACRYNLKLHVPYLLLSNSRQTICLRVADREPHLTQIALPSWHELNEVSQ